MTARFGFSGSDDEDEAKNRWKLYDDMNDKGVFVNNKPYGSRLPPDDRPKYTYLYHSNGKPRTFTKYRPRMFHFVTLETDDAKRTPNLNDLDYVVVDEHGQPAERFFMIGQTDYS